MPSKPRTKLACPHCGIMWAYFGGSRACYPCRQKGKRGRAKPAPPPPPPPVVEEAVEVEPHSLDIGREVGWDCLHLPGPCSAKLCRHHMGFDIGPNCAVRLANQGPQSLVTIGDLLGVTKERIRQIEAQALRRLNHRSRVGMIEGIE